MATTARVDELAIDSEALAAICHKFGVRRLRLYGISSDPNPNGLNDHGDVELLYDLHDGRAWTFIDLEDCAEALSPLFGSRFVHLINQEFLQGDHRQEIARRAGTLYEA